MSFCARNVGWVFKYLFISIYVIFRIVLAVSFIIVSMPVMFVGAAIWIIPYGIHCFFEMQDKTYSDVPLVITYISKACLAISVVGAVVINVYSYVLDFLLDKFNPFRYVDEEN